MVTPDALANSDSLANWTGRILLDRRIDDVAPWRMLEYWVQVEIYRAVQAGAAGPWRHLGDFEQPYHTAFPKSGTKTQTKWIDLVLAEPTVTAPKRVAWIELKDVGRSVHRIESNARGLGHDLAAVSTLDPPKTQETWLHPPSHVVDRGRLPEWNAYGPQLGGCKHLISQIVVLPKSMIGTISEQRVQSLWQSAFKQRTGRLNFSGTFRIGRAETNAFIINAIVSELPNESEG